MKDKLVLQYYKFSESPMYEFQNHGLNHGSRDSRARYFANEKRVFVVLHVLGPIMPSSVMNIRSLFYYNTVNGFCNFPFTVDAVIAPSQRHQNTNTNNDTKTDKHKHKR